MNEVPDRFFTGHDLNDICSGSQGCRAGLKATGRGTSAGSPLEQKVKNGHIHSGISLRFGIPNGDGRAAIFHTIYCWMISS